MLLLWLVASILAIFGLYKVITEVSLRYRFRDCAQTPRILLQTIEKHGEYRTDRAVAESILNSYMKTKNYLNLLIKLEKQTKVKIPTATGEVKNILSAYEMTALKYRNTSAYEVDRELARRSISNLESRIEEIKIDTGTVQLTEKSLLELNKPKESYLDRFLLVHNENLRKCDIIRPHNHKAVPLKDLSKELMKTLENIEGKDGMELAREEIYAQLNQLSEVIDNSLEELPTYDSKKFVSNKLQVSKRIIEEIDNSQYVDVFKVGVD